MKQKYYFADTNHTFGDIKDDNKILFVKVSILLDKNVVQITPVLLESNSIH